MTAAKKKRRSRKPKPAGDDLNQQPAKKAAPSFLVGEERPPAPVRAAQPQQARQQGQPQQQQPRQQAQPQQQQPRQQTPVQQQFQQFPPFPQQQQQQQPPAAAAPRVEKSAERTASEAQYRAQVFTEDKFVDVAGLSPQTKSALAQFDFKTMTRIQSLAIPAALKGQDVLIKAKTGHG